MNYKLKLALVASAIGAVIYGFEVETKAISSCVATVDRVVYADFEEDYVCPYVNSDGYTIVDICTSYTTKQASTVLRTVTRDGVGKGPRFKDGYYMSDYPTITADYTSEITFVGYRQETKLSIAAYYDDGSSHFKSDYLGCMLDVGKESDVLVWYGMGGLHL